MVSCPAINVNGKTSYSVCILRVLGVVLLIWHVRNSLGHCLGPIEPSIALSKVSMKEIQGGITEITYIERRRHSAHVELMINILIREIIVSSVSG